MAPQLAEDQSQPIAGALVEETFGVETLNVIGNEAQPGVPPSVVIRFLVGQFGPNLFMSAKLARIAPELAISLGEHLVTEGRRVQSRVAPASAADLAKLKRPGR